MEEYFIFQKHFDTFIYLQDRKKVNKKFFLKHGGQIPSKFNKKYSQKEILDHAYLNLIHKSKDNLKNLVKNDYLELIKFLNITELKEKLLCIAKPKVLNYFFENFKINKLEILIDAVENNNLNLIKFIMKKGFDLRTIDENNELIHTPLYAAIKLKNFEIAKFLIENGHPTFWTVYKSCLKGTLEDVKFLFNNGADFEFENGEILNISIFENKYDIVKYLIKKGAIINNDLENDAPFVISMINAITFSDLKMPKLLIDNGADVNISDSQALITICEEYNDDDYSYEAVKFLIKNGINIHARNEEALIVSCMFGGLDIVKLLIKHGADINAQNGQPIYYARQNGYQEIVDYLIKKGASDNSQSGSDLIKAICDENYEDVKRLIKNGADVHYKNDLPLIRACGNSTFKIVKYLIDHGANVNAENDDPIIVATLDNNIEVIKLLFERGANIFAVTDDILKNSEVESKTKKLIKKLKNKV